MRLQEKRPWGTLTLFSLILLVTAVALEWGFAMIDPWRLPAASELNFEVNAFPSLAGLTMSCDESLTGKFIVEIDLGRRVASCGAILTQETTRCEGSVPLRGFADKIRCAKLEGAQCESGGVQALGLFKGDVACANSTSETDLGPPAPHRRGDDL